MQTIQEKRNLQNNSRFFWFADFYSNLSPPWKSFMSRSPQKQQNNNISSFIETLLSPPRLSNPIRKSTSQKYLIDPFNQDSPPNEPNPSHLSRNSPAMYRNKSEDKPVDLFSSTRSYVQQFPGQNSIFLSKISQLSEQPLPLIPNKEVRFRENLVQKNAKNKRQNYPQQSRTPSILKRSQLIRENAANIIHNTLNGSQSNRHNSFSSMPVEDREIRALKTNDVVRKRYFAILERFQAKFSTKLKKNMRIRSDQKYRDELFPPIISSICRGGLSRNSEFRIEDIRWIRLPDLFKNRRLCIVGQTRSHVDIYCNKWRTCGNFIGDAFTCLKDCPFVLHKIFEENKINQFGVYLVKIFQQNVWKYVIVDDFVPVVIDNDGNPVPLFLNICQLVAEDQPIQIWPFLLQKAYANYYANYQSLHFGNVLDFLEELTGCSSQVFHFLTIQKKMAEAMSRLSIYLQRDNIIMLGHIEQHNIYIPLVRKKNGTLMAKQSFQEQSSGVLVTLQNMFEYFDRVHVISPSKWPNRAVSTIGINIKRGGIEPARFDISLRMLKVCQPGQVTISLRQKQRRFYQNSSLNYNYIWNRMIILQKQFDGQYRWITGKYSNSKTINYTDYFQAGQYCIIVMPEWKCSHCYQLSMIALSPNQISLTRKEYDDKERLIEKGCADLAQRFGKLQQINLYACSYCYVMQEIGFIIENINNERFNGDIRVNRSIGGIKASVDIVPFNIEFYQQNNNKIPFKTQISVYISSDQQYTVVLMSRGGIDATLLKRFDFAK